MTNLQKFHKLDVRFYIRNFIALVFVVCISIGCARQKLKFEEGKEIRARYTHVLIVQPTAKETLAESDKALLRDWLGGFLREESTFSRIESCAASTAEALDHLKTAHGPETANWLLIAPEIEKAAAGHSAGKAMGGGLVGALIGMGLNAAAGARRLFVRLDCLDGSTGEQIITGRLEKSWAGDVHGLPWEQFIALTAETLAKGVAERFGVLRAESASKSRRDASISGAGATKAAKSGASNLAHARES